MLNILTVNLRQTNTHLTINYLKIFSRKEAACMPVTFKRSHFVKVFLNRPFEIYLQLSEASKTKKLSNEFLHEEVIEPITTNTTSTNLDKV